VNIAVRLVTLGCGWLMTACNADPRIGYRGLLIIVAWPGQPREILGKHHTLISA